MYKDLRQTYYVHISTSKVLLGGINSGRIYHTEKA